jgi:phytoene dehydrogenase-like protein
MIVTEGYDVVIIGGGHNGLTAAAYLARAGKRVLVLERSPRLGGAVATEEIAPGFRGSTGADVCGLLQPQIVRDLNLVARGVHFLPLDPAVVALGDGSSLRIWRDLERTKTELAAKSPRDAEAYPRFVAFLTRFASAIAPLLEKAPPNVASPRIGEQMVLLRRAFALRRMGKETLQQMLRLPPMSVRNLLNEWFESDLLKASLAVDALLGTFQGPFSPGTAFGLVSHFLPAVYGGDWAFVRGGMSVLADALAQAAKEAGAKIRTDAEVVRIVTGAGRANAVQLADGEVIGARAVASSADPKRTFLHLVRPEELSPEFLLQVRNIAMNGVVAKVNLALDGPPPIPVAGNGLPPHVRIAPSLEYLERAYDDAKYGRLSSAPFVDVFVPSALDPSLAPAGMHILSAVVQYAPYDLRGGDWTQDRDVLAERVIGRLEEHMPGLEHRIIGRSVLSPRDLESRFGMTEGHIYHGEMTLDQSLVLRPVPGWARYRTPIEGLYLCGAGAHPGGGITGAPGHNAARQILADWTQLAPRS